MNFLGAKTVIWKIKKQVLPLNLIIFVIVYIRIICFKININRFPYHYDQTFPIIFQRLSGFFLVICLIISSLLFIKDSSKNFNGSVYTHFFCLNMYKQVLLSLCYQISNYLSKAKWIFSCYFTHYFFIVVYKGK